MKPKTMNSDKELSNLPAEDRAALREELLRTVDADRLHVFDALDREADQDDGVPEMPESLRDQLIAQFGDRAPKSAVATPPTVSIFFANLVEFFKAKPLASYGGLAAAACAVMFMMFQFGGGGGDGSLGKVDRVRGGGDGGPSATADVVVYLFPESKAGAVVAEMAQGREVIVCADEADFDRRLGGGLAVAVDLDRRVILSFEKGQVSGEVDIEEEGVRSVLLGIRNVLDEMIVE
ncbi:MAG: hypothetical protein ACI8XO_000869 [Verrucomicrobiales bacterium]